MCDVLILLHALEYNCLLSKISKWSWKLNKLFGVNFIKHDHVYLVENYFQVLNNIYTSICWIECCRKKYEKFLSEILSLAWETPNSGLYKH